MALKGVIRIPMAYKVLERLIRPLTTMQVFYSLIQAFKAL